VTLSRRQPVQAAPAGVGTESQCEADPRQREVSGLHHNVFGAFFSLRGALLSVGAGEMRARNFVYRGLTA
jgi:hypothetical protein